MADGSWGGHPSDMQSVAYHLPVLCYDTARVPPSDEAERSLMPLAC